MKTKCQAPGIWRHIDCRPNSIPGNVLAPVRPTATFLRRRCWDGRCADTKSLTAMDWGSVFSRVKKLMTRRIILESTAGKHLFKELTAADDLLSVLIIPER